jgi:hypothetical protein
LATGDLHRNRWKTVMLRTTEWLPLAIAIGMVLYRLRDFLVPGTLPQRGGPGLPFQGSDLTPAFAAWEQMAMHALWREHTFPFWTPFIQSGAPLFGTPQAGAISLGVLLGALFPAEAAIKWAMLIHVVAGMSGVYALGRIWNCARVPAAVAALAFALGPFLLDSFRVGHLSQLLPMGVMPWVFVGLWKAANSDRGLHRWALITGALIGIQFLEGGDSAILYEAMGMLAIAGGLVVGPDRRIWLLRLSQTAGLVALAAFAVSAMYLLPLRDYVATSSRGNGLSLEVAQAQVEGVDPYMPGIAYLIAAGIGAVALFVSGRRRAALWISLVAVTGLATAKSPEIFALWWRFVPGFRYVRIPVRAMVMTGVAAPVLIAAAIEGVTRLIPVRSAAVAASVLLAVPIVREMWKLAPGTPSMASPKKEIEANYALRWVADHTHGERMHIWETPNRHWGTEHVTVPLGLEVLAGYTPTEHADYLAGDFDPPGQRNFLMETYAAPAKLWGMLNVRYVLSQVPRNEPGFHLAAQVPRCPLQICQPAKSSGPFIYEDDLWLPRAWRVPHTVAVVGPSRRAFEVALDILEMPQFDPSQVAVIQTTPEEPLPNVDAAVATDPGIGNLQAWGSAEARATVESVLALPRRDPVQAASVKRLNGNRIRVEAPGNGWLVISERLALFHGWRGRVGEAPQTIHRADGVLAATETPPGSVIDLSYRPPGFLPGVGLLAVVVSGLIAVEIFLRRRRVQQRAARLLAKPLAA